MNRRLVTAAVAAGATLMLSVVPMGSATAQRCVSGADVRGRVAEFVHSLHGDVGSPAARTAVKGALVESVRAARGVKADTPHERQGLGAEISALARQLKDATNKVERAALIAEIHALQDQKKAEHTTGQDVQTLRQDLSRLKTRLVAKSDTHAQGREIAAFVHDLMAQFDC